MTSTPDDASLRHRVPHISMQAHHGYAPHSHADSTGHEGVPLLTRSYLTPGGHRAEAQRLLAVIDDRLENETVLELAVIALAHATLAAGGKG